MPQLFLGVNPGTTIKDASAPALLPAATEVDGETVTGDPVKVNFPGEVVAELVLGALDPSTVLTVEIQGADNLAFDSGVVSYGGFDSIGANDDGQTRYRDLQLYKQYARAVAIESAGAAVITSLTLVPKATGLTNTRTA